MSESEVLDGLSDSLNGS